MLLPMMLRFEHILKSEIRTAMNSVIKSLALDIGWNLVKLISHVFTFLLSSPVGFLTKLVHLIPLPLR